MSYNLPDEKGHFAQSGTFCAFWAQSGTFCGVFYFVGLETFKNLTVTRLAQGIPIGGEVHYLDENTLNTAFQSRKKIV